MAKLVMRIAQHPRLLLAHAADGFLAPRPATTSDPFPTVPYLLALRQGGLRDDVLAMAEAAGIPGWFDPSLCVFHELPSRLGVDAGSALGEFERLALVSLVLRERANGPLAPLDRPDAYVDSVDRLFGELAAEGIAAGSFQRALDGRVGRDAFEAARDAVLADAYQDYCARLTRLGKCDGRDLLVSCARLIDGDPSGERLAAVLGGRREIRLVGLQDLRGGWRPLLDALVKSPALDRVLLYTSVPLLLASIEHEVERLDEPASTASCLFGTGQRVAEGAATLIVAPDVDREVDDVALRVRALIESGVPARKIAVVARQARPYVDRALVALSRLGVPATARQRVVLTHIPVVRAIRSLFAGAADGWTRHALAELAEQPYLDCGLSAAIVDEIGYRRRVVGLAAWETAIRALEARARERDRRIQAGEEEDTNGTGAAMLPTADITATREAFGPFAARARALDRSRTLLDWLDWLAKFLEQDPWRVLARIRSVPGGRFDVVRLDLAGWNGLIGIVDEWKAALEELGTGREELDVAAFARQLEACLTADVALWTPTREGVNVLEALAAAYRSFDHVFLVGMDAGSFPKASPVSPILDDGDRVALGAAGLPLETREDWELRERELFRSVVASARERLTVSFARLDGAGREVIRSAFVEELSDVASVDTIELPAAQVVIPGVPLYRTTADLEHARFVARIERERAEGAASPYNGRLTDPELLEWLAVEFGDQRVWSPTQLEEMAKCPWAYFSKRLLGTERLEEPTEDMEPSVRGVILHDALRRFYEAARARGAAPVFLRSGDATWAMPLLDRAVNDAFEDAATKKWVGHPALRPGMLAELRRILQRFLAWEIQQHEHMYDTKKRNAPKMIRTGVVDHELAFDDMVLERGGVRLRYRGIIDRVEVGVDERVPGGRFLAASDYKTTKSSTPGKGEKSAWEDGVVLQIPLYAYALSRLRPDETIARVDYLTLRKPEQVHALQFAEFDRKSASVVESEAAKERWQQALDGAIVQIRRARGGEFPAEPAPSCGCPDWCHGRDICRVPGGPR